MTIVEWDACDGCVDSSTCDYFVNNAYPAYVHFAKNVEHRPHDGARMGFACPLEASLFRKWMRRAAGRQMLSCAGPVDSPAARSQDLTINSENDGISDYPIRNLSSFATEPAELTIESSSCDHHSDDGAQRLRAVRLCLIGRPNGGIRIACRSRTDHGGGS